MDLGTIQDFVRTSLDTDDTELPDSLLNVYISEGYDNVIALSNQWSFFHVEDTLTTVADTQSYNIAGNDTDRNVAFPYAYRSITDLRGETWSLQNVGHAAIRSQFRITSPSTARPTYWSEHGDLIYLWAIPDGAYEIVVSGYRSPIDWLTLGSGSEPDGPDEMSDIIAMHALARGFAQQLDLETAQYYHAAFAQRSKQFVGRYTTPLAEGPKIHNGGTRVDLYKRNGLGPLIYPFE
jgi:hypothetical protein